MKSLGDHFGSHTNIAVARFRFRQRQQQYGELVREYEACLRQLARKCKFGTMENEMLRDQLIEKTNIPKVRKIFVGIGWAVICKGHCQVENALAEAQQMARTVGESLEYSTQVHLQSLSGGSLGNSIQEVSIRRQSDGVADKSKCSLLSTTQLNRGKLCVVIVNFLTTLQAIEHVLQKANSADNVGSTTILPDVVYLSKTVKWSIVLTQSWGI